MIVLCGQNIEIGGVRARAIFNPLNAELNPICHFLAFTIFSTLAG